LPRQTEIVFTRSRWILEADGPRGFLKALLDFVNDDRDPDYDATRHELSEALEVFRSANRSTPPKSIDEFTHPDPRSFKALNAMRQHERWAEIRLR
jgi:hypothetical protein